MNELKGLIDCHTHTYYSPDSDADPEKMVEKAIDLGLEAYAITDHCECNRWYSIEHYNAEPNEHDTYEFRKDFERSLSNTSKLKEIYKSKINLVCGIELGQATHDFEIADKAASDNRLDFIIGSMHELPNRPDFCFIKYENYTKSEIDKLLENYFSELLKLCKWGKFDVLGHLTYTLRYIEGEYGLKIDLSKYDDIIEECFKTIIQKSKGIEINTSGLRQKYGKPFPELKYIKLYKELGGEIISLGSDAHTVSDLGKGIAECALLAQQSGFKYLTYFIKHKPVFVKI